MTGKSETGIVPVEHVVRQIHVVRGHKVLLDADLAQLYGVPTKQLVQAVKRNLERFPSDFMFQLASQEQACLRSQIVTSKRGRGGRRYPPYAFTEQGVAMLSSVLNSGRAVQVNIAIMRAFVKLREIMATEREEGADTQAEQSQTARLGDGRQEEFLAGAAIERQPVGGEVWGAGAVDDILARGLWESDYAEERAGRGEHRGEARGSVPYGQPEDDAGASGTYIWQIDGPNADVVPAQT